VSVPGALGLLLLACAGYSAGAVLALRRAAVPELADVAAVAALWAAALAAPLGWGRWTLAPAVLAAALAVGACSAPARAVYLRRRAPGAREAREAPEGSGAWRRFGMRMGNFQGRLLMALLYFTVVAPFALVSRLAAAGPPPAGERTRWRAREAPEAGLDAARRQH